MNKNKNILVTASTGTTGRRLVPLLRARGMRVKAASRTPDDTQVAFDWDDRDTHAAALKDVDAIYLIPPSLVEDATAVIAPFLAQARAAGVKQVVLLSSMGAGFPGEPSNSGRRTLEAIVRDSGMQWTILRPSGFMQNFSEGFLVPAVQHGVIPNPAGAGKVAMVDAGDIARVAATVFTEPATHAEQTYDVTGSQLQDFPEVAQAIAHATQREVQAMPMTSPQFLAMLQQAGVPAGYAEMLVRDQEAIRDGAAAVVSDVVERVGGRAAVGFSNYAREAAPQWSA